jgi:hypothetical protein
MAFRLVGHGEAGTTPAEFSLGRRKQYRNALRKAIQDVLGADVARVEIFQGQRLAAVCERQYRKVGRRGGKFSVVCSGEKPKK